MTPEIDKLQSLYRQLDRQQAAGEDVVAELKKEINNLELAYLKEHILPEVAKFLASKVGYLRCVIDSNFQYDGGKRIDFSFCTSGSMLLVKDSVEINTVGESPASVSSQNTEEQINSNTTGQDSQSQPKATTSDNNRIYKRFATQIMNLKTEINKAGYKSPHKAILLLAIFEAIHDGVLKENKIYFNPSLIKRYEDIWQRYVPVFVKFDSSPSATYVHLASEPFYTHALYNQLKNVNQNWWTPSRVRSCIRYAKLDDRLFSIVKDRYQDFKELLVDNYLTFDKSVKSAADKPVIATFSEDTGYNLDGFKEYLSLMDSQLGKKYSQSSIDVYASSLKSEYIVGKVKKFLPSGNIFEISSINVLNQLFADVLEDISNKIVSKSYSIVVKLYRQYVKAATIQKTKPSERVEPSTTLPSQNHSGDSKKLPCNDKLKLIITPSFSLTGATPTAMIAAFIRRVGVKKVYDLKIPYLGKYLVDTERHPKYISQAKFVDGYWVNTCSSTPKKIEQMQEIADRLGINIKFIIE